MDLNFIRVEAVDGKELSREVLQALCRPKTDGMPWTAQEVGVALSHRECWRRAASSQEKYSIILEDDLFFSDDAADYLGSTSWLPGEFDALKLETVGEIVTTDRIRRKNRTRQVVRLHSRHLGAGAYIISREFAQRLSSLPDEISDQSDVILFSDTTLNKIYQLTPAICIQDYVLNGHRPGTTLGSTLEDERIPLRRQPKPKGLKKVWREASRPFYQLANLCFVLGRAVAGKTTGRINYKRQL